jgi:hypothetical protein
MCLGDKNTKIRASSETLHANIVLFQQMYTLSCFVEYLVFLRLS